jgi:hypothetical protein
MIATGDEVLNNFLLMTIIDNNNPILCDLAFRWKMHFFIVWD